MQLFKAFASVNLTAKDGGWSLDFKNSKFAFNDEAPHVQLKLTNFSCDFDGTFDLHTDPLFYKDQGNCFIKVAPLTLDLGFKLVDNNGVFQFEEEASTLTYNKMNITFNGTADISYALTAIFNMLDATMQKDADKYAETILSSGLFPLINGVLSEAGTSQVFKNMTIDYSAMAQPVTTKEAMTLVLKGEVTPEDGYLPFAREPVIPDTIDTSAGDLQLFISDFVFNSTVYSAFKAGLLHTRVENLNTNDLAIVFPKLKEEYENTTADVEIKAIGDPYPVPSFRIEEGETYLDSMVRLAIKVKDHSLGEIDMIVLDCNLTSTLNFEIRKGFVLDPDITSLKIKVEKIVND